MKKLLLFIALCLFIATQSFSMNNKSILLRDFSFEENHKLSKQSPSVNTKMLTSPITDLALNAIIAPITGCGYGSTEDVIICVKNLGGDTINGNIVLKYQFAGSSTIITETSQDTLKPGDSLIYTFTTKVNLLVTNDSILSILATVNIANDSNSSNDSLAKSFYSKVKPQAPTVTNCSTTFGNTATLVGSTSSGTIFWYSSITSPIPFAINSPATSPVLYDTTIFYARSFSTNGCTSLPTPITVNVTGIPFGELSITDILVNEGCGLDSNETVSIKLYNNGYGNITSGATVSFKLNNNNWTSQENITTTLISHGASTYTFTAKANMFALSDTLYNLKAVVNYSGDINHANDTLLRDSIISNYTPLKPIFTSPVTCPFASSATLTASSPDSILWYIGQNSSLPFNTGSSYTTAILFSDTSFWLEAIQKNPTKILTTTFVNSSGYNRGTMFDINATKSINIDSFLVSTKSNTTLTFNIYYIQGSYSSAVQTPAAWTLLGSQTVTPSNNLAVVSAGTLNIPAGFTYGIYIKPTMNYTNFHSYSGTPPTYSDANITLTQGQGFSLDPWTSGGLGYSREFNGKVYYSFPPNGCVSQRDSIFVDVANPPAIDPAMESVISPIALVAEGAAVPISVKLKNFGTTTLQTANITYERDGNIISTYSWSGNIAFNSTSAPITIYTDTFSLGHHQIRFWVTNANGSSQTANANDTISYSFNACLSGNYTVGNATSDFSTIDSAINMLDSVGIVGSVYFNIKPGTYNSHIILKQYSGASNSTWVTFQSSTGDSTDVTIQRSAASSSNNTVGFNNGQYYKLKSLTLKALNSSYGRVIMFEGNTHHIKIENCILQGTTSSSTSSNVSIIYNTSSSSTHDIFIKNNKINNGSYGMYYQGKSNNSVKNIFIENNVFSDFNYYGLYLRYLNNVYINNNVIKTSISTGSSHYGMYLYKLRNYISIDANDIQLNTTGTSRGIYLYYCKPSNASKATIITNNFISVQNLSNSYSHGFYCYRSKHLKFYNNSVNVTGTSSLSASFYEYYCTNIRVKNCIFVHNGSGYAYYIKTTSAIAESDYNDYYSNGNYLAYWNGNKSTLSALKAANNKDTHSKNVLPMFISTTNLHTSNPDLNGFGHHEAIVVKDIDGDLRNSTSPDIGADEFSMPANDAGITSLDAPTFPIIVGNNTFAVTIRNFGTDTLTSATIAWSVNNVAQTPFSWTGSLAKNQQADSVVIGNCNLSNGVNILKFWSINPNNFSDDNNTNDTLSISQYVCSSILRGNYTIGGTSADYADFASAIMNLNTCGIDSDVVFLVNAGSYTEQLEILPVVGADSSNTITFRGATGDSSDITLTYSPSNTANYTIYLNGADYFRFENMTIKSTGNYKQTILIENGACNNVFSHNILKTSGTTTYSKVVVTPNTNSVKNENNKFVNNRFENGQYAIYLYGHSGNNRESGLYVVDNYFSGYKNYALYGLYQKGVVFKRNILRPSTSSAHPNGIKLSYLSGGCDVSYNDLLLSPQSSSTGIHLTYSNGSTANRFRIYNNMINITSGTYTNYGVYLYSPSYVDIVYNTIKISSGNNASKAFYISGSQNNNCRILNNIFANMGGGYCYYVNIPYSGNSGISLSDHNDFYTTGAHLARWGSYNLDSLTQFRDSTGLDSNSISCNPGFYSSTNLHAVNVLLNAAAVPITGIVDDYDNETRNATTPDIGADEFDPIPIDAAVISISSPMQNFPCDGQTKNISIVVRNLGTDTITSMNIAYKYATGNAVVMPWTGSLLSLNSTTITFSTPITWQLGYDTLCVYVQLTNDGNHANDTVYKNYKVLEKITPPLSENFDNLTKWATPGNEWERGTPQGTFINSAHSSPNVWMTRLSTNYSNNADEVLLTTYFDFSNITQNPTLKFWHNNRLETHDGVTIEYSTDEGVTWTILGYVGDTLGTNWFNGAYNGHHFFTGNSNAWVLSTYNLKQFKQTQNPVQFRFRLLTTSSGINEGMAIDDFSIEIPQTANDVGVTSISSPSDTTKNGQQYSVSVMVKNFGTQSQSVIPISYQVGNNQPVNDSILLSSPLVPGDSVSYTFSNSFTAPASNFKLCVYTTLTADGYLPNNKKCKNIIASPLAYDAGVIAFVKPTDTTAIGQATSITIRIKNFGTNSFNTCPISFKTNNNPYITETWTGSPLAPGDSIDYTFSKTYISSQFNYTICAKTVLNLDSNKLNDSLCKYIIADEIHNQSASAFKLWQNQPNPSKTNTIIVYEIPTADKVHFELLNILGELLISTNENKTAGLHQIKINTSNLPVGIYYYSIEYKGSRLVKKMLVQ